MYALSWTSYFSIFMVVKHELSHAMCLLLSYSYGLVTLFNMLVDSPIWVYFHIKQVWLWQRFHRSRSKCGHFWEHLYFFPFMCRELNLNLNLWGTKNRENTRQRKTITRTRQYLRDSVICLRTRSCKDFTIIREKYKVRLQFFLSQNTAITPSVNLPLKTTQYYSSRVVKPD